MPAQAPRFFRRSELTRSLWTFRHEFAVVGGLSMLANVLMLAPTLYMLQVYDRVLASQSELTLVAISILTLALFAIMALAEWMRSTLLVQAGLKFDEQLSTRVFNSSFQARLSQSSPQARHAFNDLIQIRQFLTGNGVFAFFDTPWVPIYIAVLFFLHPILGVLSLIFAVVQACIAVFGNRTVTKPAEVAQQSAVDTSVFLHSKIRNAEVLESMGMIANVLSIWSHRQQHTRQLNTDVHHLTHRLLAISKFIRYSQQSLVLGAGALLVIDGQLSPGGMIAANVLMTRALSPIDMVVSGWRQFAGMKFSFIRLENMLREFPQQLQSDKGVTPQGYISALSLCADVPGTEQRILHELCFDVQAGSSVAILGPSGSGKSTLARVLVGIWPRVSGQLLLDGADLNSWNRTELGSNIGYLPQDIELFEGTISENIARFGFVDSTQVITAAKNAGLHNMILKYPQGYDTLIGDAGNLLSGGQRQRVALARALYGNPALVVLDEPDANLDAVGEAALTKAISRLKTEGKTVFFITHRSAAVTQADYLILLRQGVVHAAGPREEVLSKLRNAAINTSKNVAAHGVASAVTAD